MPFVCIGHIKSDEHFLTVSFVSGAATNDAMMLHHGVSSNCNVMLIIYIDNTSKLNEQLSVNSLLFQQYQHLYYDAKTNNTGLCHKCHSTSNDAGIMPIICTAHISKLVSGY